MDSLYRKLRSEGVGVEKYSAEPFTIDDENKLWSLGIMGTGSLISLRAVFSTTTAKIFACGVVTSTGI